MKAFEDDKIYVNEKFKFVLERVENVGKGENTGYQHFLLFPQCFQMASYTGSKVKVFADDKIEVAFNSLPPLTTLKKEALENTVEKGENEPAFSPFSSVFYSIKERNCHFSNV